jgi:hypothetical protein
MGVDQADMGWVGRGRGGHGLLRDGAAVFLVRKHLRTPLLASAGAGEIGGHDHRDHQAQLLALHCGG